MTHAHITMIALTIILFIITLILQRQGRNIKLLQMVLRVMYLLIIITGGMLFFSSYKISFLYVLKAILGLIMIGLFEMTLMGKKKAGLIILLVLVFVFTVYLGLKLPMGMYL